MKILIVGSSGHAKVVADILLASPDAVVLGFIARGQAGGEVLGLPVLGQDEDVSDIAHDGVVIAIGDNQLRKKLFAVYRDMGETLTTAIHPSAVIAPDAEIGNGCMICAGVVVNPGSRILDNTILNTGCTVDHDCTVGPHAHVAPGASLAGNVTVGEGGFVGIGASVIQGIEIGPWSTVGAGAAVIHDVSPMTTVVGVPARERVE